MVPRVSGLAIPPARHFGLVGDSVLDDARALLARIKSALSKPGIPPGIQADTDTLRRAAGVLAGGAREAVRVATGPVVTELKALASEAAVVAKGGVIAMAVIGYLLWEDSKKGGKSDDQSLLIAGLLWALSRGLV